MAARIRLLATDLEALTGGSPYREPCSKFAEQLRSLRDETGCRWAVISGRSRRRVLKLLANFNDVGVAPDYLVLKYAYLYRRTDMGYVPCLRWSASILWRLLREPALARKFVDDWYEKALMRYESMNTLIRTPYRLRMRFEDLAEAAEAAQSARLEVSPYRHLRVFDNDAEVEIMPVPFVKGMALRELSEKIGVPAEEILAIGCGRSDVSMLDRDVAGFCGCPANADARVQETVFKNGGHLSQKKMLAGAVDVITAYRTGTVSAVLPADWRAPLREMFMPERPWGNLLQLRRFGMLVMAALVFYIIFLIFAMFDILPFSNWIRMPYEWLLSRLVSIL